jgi:serine O-acetyltransferase
VHRLAHYLWHKGRTDLALFIQSRNSEVFSVDIHPAALIGKGVMFDHATGIVIGETAVVEDNVSILQGVTLGGTGNESGDRHPKVREGVMIGSGAKILGNIEIGKGSKVGAGSVVLAPVKACRTVAGVPAKVVGKPSCTMPCDSMDQNVFADSKKG